MYKCKADLRPTILKELLSKEDFERYETLALQVECHIFFLPLWEYELYLQNFDFSVNYYIPHKRSLGGYIGVSLSVCLLVGPS